MCGPFPSKLICDATLKIHLWRSRSTPLRSITTTKLKKGMRLHHYINFSTGSPVSLVGAVFLKRPSQKGRDSRFNYLHHNLETGKYFHCSLQILILQIKQTLLINLLLLTLPISTSLLIDLVRCGSVEKLKFSMMSCGKPFCSILASCL